MQFTFMEKKNSAPKIYFAFYKTPGKNGLDSNGNEREFKHFKVSWNWSLTTVLSGGLLGLRN